MIQRIQTLFLLEIAFLCISLMFIPVQYIVSGGTDIAIKLVPVSNELFHSSPGHFAAVGINIFTLIITFITIFMFKKRELQIKLCYLIVILFVVLISMFAFCPLVNLNETLEVKDSLFGYFILIIGSISAFLAARYVKKDIELLKSTDRIR